MPSWDVQINRAMHIETQKKKDKDKTRIFLGGQGHRGRQGVTMLMNSLKANQYHSGLIISSLCLLSDRK